MYKVYKVLSHRKNKLVSYNIATEWISKYELEYKVGEVTEPKIPNSLLFAFLDVQEAVRFRNVTKADIYLAETPWYIAGILPQWPYENSNGCHKPVIEDFWQNYKTPADSYTDNVIEHMKQYKTSICCPSLKLLEKVY